MASINPITIQKQVRDNASDLQQYLSDLTTWSTHMKAKELAESGADLEVRFVNIVRQRTGVLFFKINLNPFYSPWIKFR